MILEAKGIHKSFQNPHPIQLLSDVSLEVRRGESIAIVGRSGEGKTTLLHILGTLEPFDIGELWVAGEAVSAARAPKLRSRYFGFVFQAFNLLEDFTAVDNVLMPARIARVNVPREHGLALLAQVGLEARADFPVKLLSGGERQRVAIARALCNNPEVIFADEPSGNLDRASAHGVAQMLFELVDKFQKALVLVTHDPALASRCQRQLMLSGGRLNPS